MAKHTMCPERLFDRPWRGGGPFRPRLGRARRWSMAILLVVLLAVIFGYWTLTDSRRVRAMAEQYLSQVLGTRVVVERATLSIFEGLRLDGIQVMVDDSSSPDAVVFTADAFRIDYSPRSVLQGKLEASQIVAIGPRVWLTEDPATGTWNYQRIARREQGPRTRELVLPQIVLRDARVDYSEYLNGEMVPQGSMAIEGRLWPAGEAGHYAFDLQSRGQTEGIGPVVSGAFDTITGAVELRLRNFQFGRDILSMSPALPRKWSLDHELSGWVDIPEMSFTPGTADKPASFRMLTDLHGVTLTVHPREWRSRQENEINRRSAELLALARLGPLQIGGVLEQMHALADPSPIRLEKVSGRFIFTEKGVQVRDLAGRVEANAFRIDGTIDGYYPDAPARIVIATPRNEDIYLPRAPRFVESLPGSFRELFHHLRPEGIGRLRMEVRRDEPGGRPTINGYIDVLDGNFTFDRLPYPLRQVTGRIDIESNAETGEERVVLRGLRGRGLPHGPNADRFIEIEGIIGPLSAHTGVDIRATGRDIQSEPAFIEALPPEARLAFDAMEGKAGEKYPTFAINLECQVLRPPGPRSDWRVSADIELINASGRLKVFPYPLEGLTGWLRLRGDTLQLDNITAARGDTALQVAGAFSWGNAIPPGPNRPEFHTDVTLSVTDVPVDATLLSAFKPEFRQRMNELGLQGKFNLNGRVFPEGDNPLHYAFDIDLHDAELWPEQGMLAIADVSAALKLTPQTMQIVTMNGKRSDGTLSGSGMVDFTEATGGIAVDIQAQHLLLDASLYNLLPARGQEVWNSLKPDGYVDADIHFDNRKNIEPADGMRLVIRPRGLSVVPAIMPVQFRDVSGVITLEPARVVLDDVRAFHGNSSAEVRLHGHATLGEEDQWELAVSAQHLVIEPALRDALPQALAILARDLELTGPVSFDFPTFRYTSPPLTTAGSRVEFSGDVVLDKAAFKLGVPFSDVIGRLKLAASVDDGTLVTVNGTMDIDSTSLAGRAGQSLHADLLKTELDGPLRIHNLRGQIAGGDLAGRVDVIRQGEQSRYTMELFLRNADLQHLVPQNDQEIRGQLTASLMLEGDWANPAIRRGRGEISVSGRNMYKIPVMLGLLEITNLALPINSPFKQGMTRYSVQGPVVTLEQIELRSDQMRMAGSGSIDFDSRRVRLTFTTDNPNWPSLPLLGDLVKQARDQLFQIHVRGTVDEPKVSASAFDALETTIDEVFREGSRRE